MRDMPSSPGGRCRFRPWRRRSKVTRHLGRGLTLALFPGTETALAVLSWGLTGAVLVKGPGVLVKTREIRGLGGFGVTPENNSSSYEAQHAIQVEWS